MYIKSERKKFGRDVVQRGETKGKFACCQKAGIGHAVLQGNVDVTDIRLTRADRQTQTYRQYKHSEDYALSVKHR